jgi:hypothetical protein
MTNQSLFFLLVLFTQIFAASLQAAELAHPEKLSPEVLVRARKITTEFESEKGDVAQFGDSITYSMAFWSSLSWDDPGKYLVADGGLPKTPANGKWKDTLISKDGVHPSGGKNNLYHETNLEVCGYALRNWINFLAIRQLHFEVFEKR